MAYEGGGGDQEKNEKKKRTIDKMETMEWSVVGEQPCRGTKKELGSMFYPLLPGKGYDIIISEATHAYIWACHNYGGKSEKFLVSSIKFRIEDRLITGKVPWISLMAL